MALVQVAVLLAKVVDADANVCAGADDDAALVLDRQMEPHLLDHVKLAAAHLKLKLWLSQAMLQTIQMHAVIVHLMLLMSAAEAAIALWHAPQTVVNA